MINLYKLNKLIIIKIYMESLKKEEIKENQDEFLLIQGKIFTSNNK